MAVQFFLHSMGVLAFFSCLSLTLPATTAAVPQPQPEVKQSDTGALTIFRHGANAHGILAANWSAGDACAGRWTGVGCSADGRRVVSLRCGQSTCGARSTRSPTSESCACSISVATASTARSTSSSTARRAGMRRAAAGAEALHGRRGEDDRERAGGSVADAGGQGCFSDVAVHRYHSRRLWRWSAQLLV